MFRGKKWNDKFINYYFDDLIFDGYYLNGKKMDLEKNIIKAIKLYLKENIYIIIK